MHASLDCGKAPAFRTPAFRVAPNSMQSLSYDSLRALPVSRTQLMRPSLSSPPLSLHTASASSQINGFADVGSDSPLARCRGRAAIILALATFGAVCHAQMTPQDASGVTSCEIQLASCQAVLGKVGAKAADGLVPLVAIMTETGTPSSASEGARGRSSPPPIRQSCTGCMRIDSRTMRVCARTARAVQGRVRSPARTRAAHCSRPTPRSIPSRTQPAARRDCGSVERTAVREWDTYKYTSTHTRTHTHTHTNRHKYR